MKISEQLVQINDECNDILYKPCFPVDIRLLVTSDYYYNMISMIVADMTDILNTEFEDYPELQGLSGANIGVPFNIVLIKTKNPEHPLIMLNPKVVEYSKETKVVKSNCGSINLSEPIEVERHEWVKVEYYPFDYEDDLMVEDLEKYLQPVVKKFKSGTVQHEIDHNKGILIINRMC